jgi:bifunctional enzyme CysN/CysC
MTVLHTSSRIRNTHPLARVVLVGHVDHGKSTLIGRLLHETGSLPEGKLDMLKAISARRGMRFEWSFLLDSLQTERDQGITIDTSQIRLRTAARDILLIDAPGHFEFVRNMVTGAAQANAALILIDATEGVREQTRRHGYLLHLLGIRQIAVAVNKMDRIGFDEERFRALEAQIREALSALGLAPQAIVPISAREGDGVARRTDAIAWYRGPTILDVLDGVAPEAAAVDKPLRLPVQAVYKFDDRRIVAGRIETGLLKVGDRVTVMPSGKTATVRSIESWPAADASSSREAASAGYSVGITLDQDIFVERGHVIAAAQPSKAARRLRARLFWLRSDPLREGAAVTVRIGTAEVRGRVTAIRDVADPGSLQPAKTAVLGQNNVAEVDIALLAPLAADTQEVNPHTSRLVIDVNGSIAAGGLVQWIDENAEGASRPANVVAVGSAISAAERAERLGHHGAVLWLTGLPGSGKSTLARAVERRVFEQGGAPVLLDGDTLRTGLNSDLGFTAAERAENVRRLAETAAHLARQGLIAIVAAVSPAAADRARARAIAGTSFFEVHVSTPREVCESRDPKGHYREARAGRIVGFTGLDGSYEPPSAPDLAIDTSRTALDTGVDEVARLLASAGILISRR